MNFCLHDIFTDHMILQRRVAIKIVGWTEGGAKVFVAFNGLAAEGISGSDGFFCVSIGPFEALAEGEVLEAGLVSDNSKHTLVTFKDVVVGGSLVRQRAIEYGNGN